MRPVTAAIPSSAMLSPLFAQAPTGAPGPASAQGTREHVLLKKLVTRTTTAPTPADLALAKQLGYLAYLEYQLNPGAIDDTALQTTLASAYPEIFMSSQQLWAYSSDTINALMQDAEIVRAAKSNRQLYEKVVAFWRDHFNMFNGKTPIWNFMPPFYEQVVRPNALGKFPDLLKAVAQSAAMLHYLDNQLSTAAAPNQNYARELMELHTMGVDNGYTQQDVIAVARCLTGWGYHSEGSQPGAGTFQFTAAIHDNGAKSVLGTTIPVNGGLQDGVDVINILAYHPNTAGFIAGKLTKWFLGEDAPAAVVAQVKAIYMATGGDVKAMLRVILKPANLGGASPKLKRPFQTFAGAMRQLPTTFLGPGGQHRRPRFAAAGDLPFEWLTPNGPPDLYAQWSDLMLPRWNFFSDLTEGVIWDTVTDVVGPFAGTSTAAQFVDKIDALMFLSEMPAAQKQALTAYLAVSPSSSSRRRETIALAFSSPAFQWAE